MLIARKKVKDDINNEVIENLFDIVYYYLDSYILYGLVCSFLVSFLNVH